MIHTGTVAFLSGILVLVQCASLPPAYLAFLLFPLALALLFMNPGLRLAGCLACGYAWAVFIAHGILVHGLESDLEGKTLTVTGSVVSLPEIQEDSIRFEFQVNQPIKFAGKDWAAPGKVRLSWYLNPPELRPGQIWNLQVRLKRPHGFMNPGGLDYEAWLFQHRIRATGYVVDAHDNRYTGIAHGQYVDRLRYHLRAGINRHIDNRYRGLIIAFTLGDRSQVASADRSTMMNTGTYHLLAVSGLQISLVAGFFYFAALKLWSRTGGWAVRLPAPRLAVIAALVTATGYALLAGFSIPTQRALIMFAVFMSVIFIARSSSVSLGICVAVLAVLIFDPFAVMDPGFWLSFGAIMALAWGMSCRIATRGLWWRWGRAQYVVFAGLLPMSLLLFQQYALHGILANIIAIPWISLVTTPLAMAGMALMTMNNTLGEACLTLASLSMQMFWPILECLENWHFALWQQAAPARWALVCGLVGAMILLLPAGISWRWLGLLWLMPVLLPVKSGPDHGEFWFSLLDVGQGLAAVIHTHKHTLVFDTGARFSEDFNAGSAVVVPYLRQAGVSRLDKLVVSHGDNDHIGGASGLLQAFPGTDVLASAPETKEGHVWRRCRAGQRWVWDGITFQILHPGSMSVASENNLSCVLRISNGTHAVLLPGDIEKEAEYRLLRSYRDELQATVLVAPHHGSKTSSTLPFIDAVLPDVVLFPVGYRNRYRFPNQDIMRRYESRGIRSYDTARDGAVLIRFNQTGMAVTVWRKEARRFWHTVDDHISENGGI